MSTLGAIVAWGLVPLTRLWNGEESLYMTLEEVLAVINGKAVSKDVDLSMQVDLACGADLMSDVLAFTHAGTLLLTGLTNSQVVRTAEMAGVKVIVFVRGKYPPPETIALAEEKGVPLLASRYTMYETCGRLYQAGLKSCGLFDLAIETWREAFGPEPT
jgi:predicted transcriptional regulator